MPQASRKPGTRTTLRLYDKTAHGGRAMRSKASGAVGSVMFLLVNVGLATAATNDGARLAEAVTHRDAKAVQALLKQGVDVNAPRPYGATVLHEATLAADRPTVDVLLAAGARVDATDDYGVTPLWLDCL